MAAPELYLLSTPAITQTPATIAATNIASRMQTAFNQMLQAWDYAKTKMWGQATLPQDIADALDTYAAEWFELFSQLRTLMNEYIPDEYKRTDFTSGESVNYTVTSGEDGTVTIEPNLSDSGA
jgi:hypothetical protein